MPTMKLSEINEVKAALQKSGLPADLLTRTHLALLRHLQAELKAEADARPTAKSLVYEQSETRREMVNESFLKSIPIITKK